MAVALEDRLVTQMVIPVSQGTYFNTKWKSNREQLCAYDMLYHPPDYNPKAARSDRQESKIIRRNIWDQEVHKGIASTTHFQLSRPKWKPSDLPTKEFVRVQVKNENPHMRIDGVLEWAVLLTEGKPSLYVALIRGTLVLGLPKLWMDGRYCTTLDNVSKISQHLRSEEVLVERTKRLTSSYSSI